VYSALEAELGALPGTGSAAKAAGFSTSDTRPRDALSSDPRQGMAGAGSVAQLPGVTSPAGPAPGGPDAAFTPPGAREVLTGPGTGAGRGRRAARADEAEETLDSGIQVRLGPIGAGPQPREAPRRDRPEPMHGSKARNRILLGAGAITLVGLLAVLLWPKSSQQSPPVQSIGGTGATQRDTPKTGTPLTVSTATGDTYTVAAAGGGPDDAPRSAAPSGQAYASGDYVLTNALDRPVLLDMDNLPADLFVRRGLVPANQLPVCQQQAGVPGDFCTLADSSRIIGLLNHSQPPTQKDGDLYMPAHASYLIRISTDLALTDQLRQQDLGLYVWRAIYIPDQQARPLKFPN
jgi:hypothetical protein